MCLPHVGLADAQRTCKQCAQYGVARDVLLFLAKKQDVADAAAELANSFSGQDFVDLLLDDPSYEVVGVSRHHGLG